MHELLKVENTEDLLKENCIKVGEHLYIKKDIPLLKVNGKDIEVVFMMGGAGSRLLHVTQDNFSKHMIMIHNKPLSKYTFDLWRVNGFRRFRFLIDDSHRGESIRNFYGDGSKFGVEIKYSVETKKLGSGGALKLAIENGIIKDTFISHFPDDQIINYEKFPLDFYKVAISAFENGYRIVLLCVPGTLYPYGEVIDENGEVVEFVEKPFIKKDSFTGICTIHKDIFSSILELEPEKEIKVERTVFKEFARKGKVFKVLIPSEFWIPVNDGPTLKKFEEVVKSSQSSL